MDTFICAYGVSNFYKEVAHYVVVSLIWRVKFIQLWRNSK
jgi:hypothetical protein